MQDEMDEKAKKSKSELDNKHQKLEEKNKKLFIDSDEQRKELVEKNEEIKRMKTKLEFLSKKGITNDKELQQKDKQLQQKDKQLQQKDKQLQQKDKELQVKDKQLQQKDKQLQQVKDKLECPVCMEVPRSGPVPVCPNGHFVCSRCKGETCPTCRVAMGGARSLLAVTIIESVDHKCKFDDCVENFALEELEKHEAVCRHRSVSCAYVMCKEKVPLAKLSEHLLNTKNKRCCTQEEVKPISNWFKKTFAIVGKEAQKDRRLNWPVGLYSFSGETFAVFPRKFEGHYSFVVMMFGSSAECSKFKFEMVVHESCARAAESEMAVKYQGTPLSIDRNEDEMKDFEASEQFMNKLMSKSSEDSYKFSLSFKISKK